MKSIETWPLWIGWLVVLLSLSACRATPEIIETPLAPEPLMAANGTATVTPTASPSPTLNPTSTPLPIPTPTLVPLPRQCLLEPFVSDVADCGELSHYDIALEIDPASAQVTGYQEVHYTNQEDAPLSELYLRLLPNSPTYGGSMEIANITQDGSPVSSTLELEDTALRLSLEPPLLVGSSVTASMHFTVGVPTTGRVGHGLFSYQRGVMALPNIYPLIPVYDDEGWHIDIAPSHGDDIYTDVAAYNVRVTAPSDWRVIASGTCISDSQDAETSLWSCEAAPMRDFTLILGENFEFLNRRVDGVVVNSYFYPWHRAGGEKALQVAVDAMGVFNEHFGPYPYSELDVVETPNRLGGMEYSGLVVVEDSLYPGVAGVEWLTAHEVAHQWWFALVGSDQVNEPWLDEALTQYSTMLYYEHVYGEQRAESIRYSEFELVHQSLIRRGRNLPVGLAAEEYPAELYWKVVYDKGALYFHALREEVGDAAFFDILHTYYRRHRYRIATPESFLDVVEDVTGDRQQALFDQWIVGLEEE